MRNDSDAAAPSRRRGWAQRMRWFGAEFLVVLTGVLVALAFNAWWVSRHDAGRERAYLRQIRAELVRTEQELDTEIAYDAELFRRAARLHDAFFAVPAPPIDSLRGWFNTDHADPEPLLGTLRAIVSTGDLHLVRDDSVRAALVWLAERAGYYDQRLRRWESVVVGSFDELLPAAIGPLTLSWNDAGRPSPGDRVGTWTEAMAHMSPTIERPAFARDFSAVLDDPVVYRAAVMYMVGLRNHRRNQERMLEDVRATRLVIEQQLER